MKKLLELERMAPLQRRRFLKLMGLALGAPAVPAAVRFAANEIAGGKAYAQDAEASRGTYFLEMNLRDQWDQGHVFVAPGLATHAGLRKGQNGSQCAVFFTPDQLFARANQVFLTNDSIALDPHLDSIAFVDTCEAATGRIHGHEAANPMRSPGRRYESGGGRTAMYENDPVSNFPQGCEEFYSSTPTPATLHNYHQKTLDPTLRNGYTFKGISRSVHTAYHFGAGLPGAELDRVRSRDELYSRFPEHIEDLNVLPNAVEADALTRVLERVDRKLLEQRRFTDTAIDSHVASVHQAKEILYVREPRLVSVPLTAEETAYWSAGVPNQMCTRDDTTSYECSADEAKGQIWEQAAWAAKILTAGLTRSASIEFDYRDLHGFRPELAVRTQAQQCAITLARLIETFKNAGIYDRTLIAVYCTDGSRGPRAESYGRDGDEQKYGKNTLMLAGGMIKGGYYGDVVVTGDTSDGHTYGYRRPDATTGMPTGDVTGPAAAQLASADVWRTVAKALSIPDGLASSFPDVAGGRVLPFLLR